MVNEEKNMQMNKLAQVALFAGALTFAACNNQTGGTDVHNHDYAEHSHHGHEHTVGEQVDTALDSIEEAGEQVSAKAEKLGKDTKSTVREAKEGVKARATAFKNIQVFAP